MWAAAPSIRANCAAAAMHRADVQFDIGRLSESAYCATAAEEPNPRELDGVVGARTSGDAGQSLG